MKSFGSIIGGKPQIFHVDFKPSANLAKAFSAPVTEIATFYHSGDPTDSYLDEAVSAAEGMDKVEGFLGAAMGISYEELEKDGHKGKASVLVVGWQSKEAHMAFRETDGFKPVVTKLRGAAKVISMCHVALMQSL
jgi:heme-degrading monooxygenase HmoA